ncbi:MAG: VOC family protein [Rhodocyclaceae bacterium]
MASNAPDIVEIKAFVPARDFNQSLAFYTDLGFTVASNSGGIAYLHHANCSFLLQDFYVAEHCNNFMMHMLVEDVEAWWERVTSSKLAERYGVRLVPPADQPWAMRDFVIIDPSGVLWRIGQNIPRS